MSVKLGYLCLLLVLLSPSWAEEQQCPTSAKSCDKCIQSGPACAWCTGPHAKARCHTVPGLRGAGCAESDIYNPQNKLKVVKNDSSAEPATASLQPQELSLRLRPGVSQSFPLTITVPTDQPITELTMETTPLPFGVNITFSNITSGNPVLVQVTVEVARCPREGDLNQPKYRNGPWLVLLMARGYLLNVKLVINLECECECTRKREEYSRSCAGRGALVCGQCECHAPYIGQQCQRDSDMSENDAFCRSGPNDPVCSGRGKCVEGFCECEKPVNPKERYSGQFCECSNVDCPYHNDRICGGHGVCEFGRCRCDDDWTGEGCICSMETTSCLSTDQNLCNNRGMCQCGVCRCEPPYRGRTCEDSPF